MLKVKTHGSCGRVKLIQTPKTNQHVLIQLTWMKMVRKTYITASFQYQSVCTFDLERDINFRVFAVLAFVTLTR